MKRIFTISFLSVTLLSLSAATYADVTSAIYTGGGAKKSFVLVGNGGQVAPEEMAALLVDMAEMVGMGGMVVMTAMEPETAAITGTVMGVIMVMAQIREIIAVTAQVMATEMETEMVMHPETIMAEKGMGADYE